MKITKELMDEVEILAQKAGEATLEIYKNNFDVTYKKDEINSPLTEADMAAHRLIVAGLEKLTPDIPVISEESSRNMDYEIRKGFTRFWLVDPLDGTKEFVKKNDEFTINIGLIENSHPRAGVVVAPVLDETYRTDGVGAILRSKGSSRGISVSGQENLEGSSAVCSRSHSGEKIETLFDSIDFGETQPRGSSLKICQIAAGKADVYCRFNPTWEWDTAAADAIARAAGAKVSTPAGIELTYNKKSLKNDGGLLFSNARLHEQMIEKIKELNLI